MTERLPVFEIHELIGRGFSNINRDENGRPKAATLGDTLRNYGSSQNDKYNLRKAMQERYGTSEDIQTPMIGRYFYDELIGGGVDKKKAEEYTFALIGTFVDLKKRAKKDDDKKKNDKKKPKREKDPFKTETIKIQQTEMDHVDNLKKRIIEGHVPQKNEFHFLKKNTAINIALSGRMIAKCPEFDVAGALSTNFAFTVHDIGHTQSDYFTATDTLKIEGSNKGSGHLDYFHFSQGVYYSLHIIDTNILVSNLCGNKELAQKIICQIVNVLVTSSPEANKNRCADGRTWPEYVMIEKLPFTPRSLSTVFLNPIKGPDHMANAIIALEDIKSRYDRCYGKVDTEIMNVREGTGSVKKLIDFISF